MDAPHGGRRNELFEELAQALQLAIFYSEELEHDLANTLWAHEAALLHAATTRAVTAVTRLRRAVVASDAGGSAVRSLPTWRLDDT